MPADDYSAYKWVDVAYGGPHKRNNVVEVSDVKKPVDTTDCYRTVYRYPPAFKEHFDKNGTVSGYDGYVYADFVPIDIDKDGDRSGALEVARDALNKLLYNFEVNLKELWIYFSGNKGFHILIPADMIGYKAGKHLPEQFKDFVQDLLPDIDIDPSIYDKVRLFRLSNTKHGKSGLYKVPLTASEVLNKDIDHILDLAQKPRMIEIVREHQVNNILKEIFDDFEPPKRSEKARHGASDHDDSPHQGPPKFTKLCYHDILQGVGQGERDNCALRLAVHLRSKGYPRDIVQPMMSAWNNKNNPSMASREIDKAIKQAFEKQYDFGCNDAVLSSHCDPRCYVKKTGAPPDAGSQKEEKKSMAQKIYSLEDAAEKYEDFIKNISERKVNLGLSVLDEYMRGVVPGQACQIMARAGVGKTALMLNILSNVIVQQQIPSLVFSLEMPVAEVFERMVQISNAKSGREVERAWKGDGEDLTQMYSNTVMNYGTSYIIDDDFLTIDEVFGYYRAAEDVIGEKPQFICLDYLGRMQGGSYNIYESTSMLAKQMKNMARELEVALVFLHQTSREGGDGTTAITMDMARDSGVIEEASDYMLGLWRPDMKTHQDKPIERLKVALLKNRRGPTGSIDMQFHKKSMIIDTEQGLQKRGLLGGARAG